MKTDAKMLKTSNCQTTIISIPTGHRISSNYYPFGSTLPTRSWSDVSRTYRYGFNSKEKDFETANDAYDFGARIYDGRLGRWLSVDPYSIEYVSFSSYCYTANSPITFYDYSGKEIIINYKDKTTGKISEYKYTPGVIPTIDDPFIKKVHEAITYNMHTQIGAEVWNQLNTSEGVLIISEEQSMNNKSIDGFQAGGGSLHNNKRVIGNIMWDPDTYSQAENNDGDYIGRLSPSTALMHEAGHAQRYDNSQIKGIKEIEKYNDDLTTNDDMFENKEERRNILDIEVVYIRQLNAIEIKGNPKSRSIQPVRLNHKIKINSVDNTSDVNKVDSREFFIFKEGWENQCGDPATIDGTE